jgi:hypothetical protein
MSPFRTMIATMTLAALMTPAIATETAAPARFRVRIENVSDRTERPMTLSPGVWVIHNELGPIFLPGRHETGRGLEALAERGDPGPLARSLGVQDGVLSRGTFRPAPSRSGLSALAPGEAVEFTLTAQPGTRLSIATRLFPGEDVFLAPDETGIALFDEDDRPIAGDVTSEIQLWDAGTEERVEPMAGTDPAWDEADGTTGDSLHGVVRRLRHGLAPMDVADVIRVTVAIRR